MKGIRRNLMQGRKSWFWERSIFRRDSTGVQEGREEICKILYPRLRQGNTLSINDLAVEEQVHSGA